MGQHPNSNMAATPRRTSADLSLSKPFDVVKLVSLSTLLPSLLKSMLKSVTSKKIKVNNYSVGRQILTKRVGADDDVADADVEDITGLYKTLKVFLATRIGMMDAL